jgi:hypothetical protein
MTNTPHQIQLNDFTIAFDERLKDYQYRQLHRIIARLKPE